MNNFKASVNPVYYGAKAWENLNDFIAEQKPSSIFILVDGNTHEYCLSEFLQKLNTGTRTEVIEIETGEEHKNLQTCEGVWNALSDLDADRKSLLINLGGGVVTDLGGFVASTFRRGIKFINIPTTLLAMVDASVGGKNGVDLGNLKNQIGVVNQPEMVLIDIQFLNTLPAQEMRSGLAEILKHGLIASESYWRKVSDLKKLDIADLEKIIEESVEIKKEIVTKDPFEKNIRKSLNFGHTLGHAIESHFLTHPQKQKLLHGEAIAIGMILETFISNKLQGFSEKKFEMIKDVIMDMYDKVEFDRDDISEIKKLMKFDKKNESGKINFVLLEDIGAPVLDIQVSDDLLNKAFDHYSKV